VELQLKHFCDLKAESSIKHTMSDPAGASIHTVNQLYATIFDGILKTDPVAYEIAAQTFRLMLCLHEIISPLALLSAASITRDGSKNSLELSDLLRICSHLVVLDDELDTIRFAHASVQEYLSRLPEFSMMDANSAAASSCLIRCIDSPLSDLTLGVQPSADFDVYAAMYWPLHYNAASEKDRSGHLGDTLREFMFSDQELMPPFPCWIETVDDIVKTLSGPHIRRSDLTAIVSESATPFFTACVYGLEFAIGVLSGTSSFDVNMKNAHGNTGLYLASSAGQVRVVEDLLKLGADIAIEGGRHTTPLQAACANGHGDVVQFIIDVSSQNLTNEMITSAMHAALRNGHEDIAVMLLKKRALPISQDILGQVFETAAGMGFIELMAYLQRTSQSLSRNKKMAIRGAEKTFHDDKIERFETYYKTKALPDDATATAAFYGQNKIIEFCLNKGLDIEHEGPFGTPLRAASLMGHGATVRLLLDRDAIVSSNGSFGDALQAASMRGHLSITTMLIRSGAAVDNSGGYYGNALQAATYRGHIDVVEALLAAGASISQKGLFSDALSAAVSAGNQSIANLLLRRGYQSTSLLDDDEIMRMTSANSEAPSPTHVDLLSTLNSTHHSERSLHTDRANVVEGRDLSFGAAYESIHNGIGVEHATELADLKHHERFGSHSLLVAIAAGQESIVRSMLDYRSSIRLSLYNIGVGLKVASAAGQVGIVDNILGTPDLPGKHIPRALERAAWYGHVAVIKRLLECEEAYGPPPSNHYAPFTPMEYEQPMRAKRYRKISQWSDKNFGDKKESRWSDYFCLSRKVVETNETADNGHVMRILLLGCRGNAPDTVELALQLAPESGLQNLFPIALAFTIECDSERALEVLFRHHPSIDTIALKSACAQAEEDRSLRVLYVLIQHNSDHGYQVQNYWDVYDGAAKTKHNDLICYLNTQPPYCRDDSLFAQTFVEAARRGYVSAMKAWEKQLLQSINHELLLSQALDQACANGHVVVASYLIELGVDVNAITDKPIPCPSFVDNHFMPWHIYEVTTSEVWPRTALQACLQATPQYDRICGISTKGLKNFKDNKREFLSKQQALIKLLLREHANVNVVDSLGRNTLHSAAALCPVETVCMILASGAAIDIPDKDHKTPSIYAAWRELDSFTVLKVLTGAQEEAKPPATHTSPTVLLDAALSVFKDGFVESDTVRQVLTTGSGAVIRYLLQSQTGLQATATGFTLLLQMASADGDFEFVRLLIDRNVDFKAVGHYYGTALHAAARFGHLDCVKLLVEAGTEIASTAGNFRWTPLRAAVEGQHLAIVQCLLDWGAMQSSNDSIDQGSAQSNENYATLTSACRSGSVDLVKLLLAFSEPNRPMPDQTEILRTGFVDMSSALHIACEHGHAEVAALLIEYGADVEEESCRSLTPLRTAATAGDFGMMELLLTAGATLYDAGRDVNILRTLVVEEKPKDIIDYVLTRLLDTDDFTNACTEAPAYMRAWQEDGKFVIHVETMQSSERLLANLAALGAQQSIEMMMGSSIDMANVRPPVLQAAAYFQSYNVLFELLPMVVIPQPLPLDYQSPVYAMLEGLMPIQLKTDRFHKILCCEAWARDSFLYSWLPGRSAKDCACSNARAAASEAILKLAQVDKSHICASAGVLHLASYLGMLQVVQVCLDLGVEIDQRHGSFGSALIAAIEGGSSEVVTLLLQRDIDVNTTSDDPGTSLYPTCQTRDMYGRRVVEFKTPGTGTALHRVCQNGDREMAEVLLQHGAQVNVLIPGKGTPMHVACEKRDEELLKLLFTYGANVDIISPNLGSALHVTCKSRNAGLAKILLQHGANVNVFSSNHGTPLHAACAEYGDDATIRLLLKHGADVNSKGSKGETPLTSVLSRERYPSERLIESLLSTEQHVEATENDLDQLITGSGYSESAIRTCKRVLADNTHLKPTIETIRLLLAGLGCSDSDILRLLLARAPHLTITLDMVKQAKNLGSFELLTRHGSCIEITADLMRSFLDPLELNLIKYSVQSAPEIRPPPAVVTAIRAILDRPEPKSDGSHQGDLWVSFVKHYQSCQEPIAKEIIELIVAQHPDVESHSGTACAA
jgi:ankyrin repeat protein